MDSCNACKVWVIMAIVLTMLLSSCVPSTPPPPTATASAVPTPTYTATLKPTQTPTAIPTATSTPLPELATPRWMLLGQPGYNVEIFGEQWNYYNDDWGSMYACIRYQQNDYERYFEQCFAIIDEDGWTLNYDGILVDMLSKGYEEITPSTTFPNTTRTSLSAKEVENNQISFFEIVEAKPYFVVVEMYVTKTGNASLQKIYEEETADVMDYVLLSSLQKSQIAFAPSPTPMAPEQQENYANNSTFLISRSEMSELYPGKFAHIGDHVGEYTICREFGDRTNADVLWVSMINCLYVIESDITMDDVKEFFIREGDVLPESKYAAENYFVFSYEDGHLYHNAVLYEDGMVFRSQIETRYIVGMTLESGFTEGVDDFLHAILMENFKKYK